MQISPSQLSIASEPASFGAAKSGDQLREAFGQFVGNSLFTQMLSSMRETVEKSEYFHGGRAEEVFQGQLDQLLADELTEASSESLAGPMFELFQLQRQS